MFLQSMGTGHCIQYQLDSSDQMDMGIDLDLLYSECSSNLLYTDHMIPWLKLQVN